MTGNFTIVSNDIITSNISNGAYRLYTLLQSYCYGDKCNCYPSQKTLANNLSRSIRTIQRYIKELKDNGYIDIKHRGSISNVYNLLRKVIQQKANKAVEGAKRVYKAYKKKESTWNYDGQRQYDFNDLEAKLTEWQRE